MGLDFEQALWGLIGTSVAMLGGLLLALSFFVGVFVALLDGFRISRKPVFKQLEGVMRGLQNKEK